ncbi:sugar ABC transporter permease [Chloroflexi bacterium TSY]|nr:sugar ABC transporter permease [Chloroflexi bacterium TSY]
MATSIQSITPQKPNGKFFGSRAKRNELVAAFLFLLPNVIGFIVFMAGPVLAALGISLLQWNLLNPPKWLGFQNYVDLVTDDDFWMSLRATAYYMLGSVPLGIALSLGLAVALNQKIRGMSFYRTIYFIPVVSSMIAVALMWRWMYNPTSGILNYMLNELFEFLRLPLTAPDWLQSRTWAMPAIIFMSVWKGLGYNMVLFLAGLQGIPSHLYEAAEIDGATSWHKFRNVTLPLLTPTTFFVLIMSIIGSFQVFEQAYIMTRGGPARSTITTVYYIYENGFEWYKMGYASAVAWVLFALILIVTLVQWLYQDRWVFYE